MRARLVVGALAGFLTGCATYQEARSVSIPAIGVESVANVGEPMLQQGIGYLQRRITITESAVLKGMELKGEYTVESERQGVLGLAGESVFLRLNTQNNKACFASAINLQTTSCADGVAVVTKESTGILFVTGTSLQQTLLYSGRIGNRIRFSYREFVNDFARPNFTNDAEYDLSESREIGYRGAMIEVIEANNTRIKYRVLRNF